MENQNRVILGLDISTHCTGIAKISYNDETGELKILDSIKFRFKVPNKLKGNKAFFMKVLQFKQHFVDSYDFSDINEIVIEEALPNANNLYTVNELLQFNGILTWLLYEKTSIMPLKLSSFDARRYAFPDLCSVRKRNKKGDPYPVNAIRSAIRRNEAPLFGDFSWDCEKKIVLWDKINETFPDLEWEYNSKGELCKENFDLSDAIVCALAGLNYELYKDVPLTVNLIDEADIEDSNGVKQHTFNYLVNFCGRSMKKTLTVPNVGKS